MSCTALTGCCPRVVPIATLPSPTHKPQLTRLSCLNVLMSWHSKDSKTMLLAIPPLKRICWYQLKMFKGLPTFRTGSKVSNVSCKQALQAERLDNLETCASAHWNTLRRLLQPDDLFSKECAFSSPPSKRSANPYSDSWTFSTLVYRLQMPHPTTSPVIL